MHLRVIGVWALLALISLAASAETLTWTFQDRYVLANLPSTGQTVHAPDFGPFTGTASVTDPLSRHADARQVSTLGATHLSYTGRSYASNWACFGKSNLRVRFTITDATDYGIHGSLIASGGAGAHMVLRSLESASDLVDVRAGYNYGAPDTAVLNHSGILLPGGYQIDVFEDCGEGLTTCSFDFQIPEPGTLSLLASAAVAALSARCARRR